MFGISYLTLRDIGRAFQVTGSRVFRRLRYAPTLVRRFGIIQSIRLLPPELTRGTRLWSILGLAPYVSRFRTRDSTVLWLRPFSADLGIFHEVWDHQWYTAGSVAPVARDGTVFDIGAHIGLFSLFASKVLQAKRLVSVEPDPVNFELLSKNIASNDMENAALIRAAIAGESGERQIFNNSSNTGGHSFYARRASSRTVRTVTLTELFKFSEISECSLLKMDCEGAEMEALENAPDDLLRSVSAISLEYHLDTYLPERLERLETRMQSLGFNLEIRPRSRTIGILRGIRRS
jgi:FkbM family methyltransferase